MMLRTKKPAGETLQDWRDQDLQIEQQAQRFDRVRAVLEQITDHTSWRSQYWRRCEAQLVKRWQLMDQMRVAGVRTNYYVIGPVDHSWLEPDDAGSGGGSKPLGWSLEQQLDLSWELAQQHRLQQARRGLA
jgi:hypothetical protein